MADRWKIRGGSLLIAAIILSVLLSCSVLKETEFEKPDLKSISEEALIAFIAIDKTQYNPEEPVIATVQINNISGATQNIPTLDIKSLSFYKIEKSSGSVAQVFPIVSPNESLLNFEEVRNKDWRRRQFVLTDCTPTTGSYSIQAIFNSGGKDSIEGRPKFASAPFDYNVSGHPMYNRDLKGILLEADAIKIAAKRLDGGYENASSKLVINEAGFFDWWITFTIKKDREEVKKAYLVNPYLCVVRKEVSPYVEQTQQKTDDQNYKALKEKARKDFKKDE